MTKKHERSLFDAQEPTTQALFPGELEPPTPEAESAYSRAARAMRKAGDEPTENLESFEKKYTQEKKRQ